MTRSRPFPVGVPSLAVASWVLALAVAGPTAAQTTPGGPRASQSPIPSPRPSETSPLQCWWRTSAGSVRIGEVFDVTLTCQALDTDGLRAVPDQSRLTVAAIQLTPFEIVEGGAAPELRQDGLRLVQHTYRLRLINPDVIGHDVKLPPLAIPYRVESRVGAGAALTGRDLVHQMPQIAIRVVSQVAADAEDIRDSSEASLKRIDALRFRARALRVGGLALTVIAGALALGALVPALGLVRRGRTRGAVRFRDRSVLAQAALVLDRRLADARGAGWTPEALAEAHAAARVVAAVACGTGTREMPLARGAATPPGRLRLTRRFGRVAAAVTTPVTGHHVTATLEALPADASAGTRVRLERLRDALAALTRARYGPSVSESAAASANDAVATVRDVARELARERLWSPRAWFRGSAPATTAPEF